MVANCTSTLCDEAGKEAVGDSCRMCDQGKYRLADDPSPSCRSCGIGFAFNTTKTPCARCPAGWIQPKANATASDFCVACPAGRIRAHNSTNQACQECAKKTFQPKPGQAECKPCLFARVPGATVCSGCEAGKFGFKETDEDGCEDCPAGWWAYKGDKVECLECPKGWHANGVPLRSTNCTSCIAGTWSSQPAAFDSSTCTKCQAGTFSTILGATLASSCLNCSAGKYRARPGANHPLECVACPAGYFGPDPGRAEPCKNCAHGFYSHRITL